MCSARACPHITLGAAEHEAQLSDGKIGILPDILNTLYIVLAALVIVLPLGVGAAVYLDGIRAATSALVAVIEYAAETLSGIPSIIYGLVGMLLLLRRCWGCRPRSSAGALTLVIMNLPTVMRTTQESLKTVPQSYREGAFGLGAGKWRTIRTVVLPGCVDGVITGLHPVRGAHPRRIRGAAVYRGYGARALQLLRGAGTVRRDADGGALLSTLRSRASSTWRSPSRRC